MDKPAELMIVMPVYNEEASVRKVVMEWFQEIVNWTENFVFLAIDDGSTDRTPEVLSRLREQLGPRLEILTQENRGHGQTCLHGYRVALERQPAWVLQIDSDGQCDPQFFFRFWQKRHASDMVYGHRTRREDGWRRVIASIVLKWTICLTSGVWCVDASVPYRLMRTPVLAAVLPRIPENFFLANVAVAVLLRREGGVRHSAVPIRFRERFGGEPSVPLRMFGSRAVELVRQLRSLDRDEVIGVSSPQGG
jgi:glycosyltransferase involved in cell wall biosynthesis